MPVLDADKILIPINANKTHWVLGCVNIRDKRIEFYDSLSDGTTMFAEELRKVEPNWKPINPFIYLSKMRMWIKDEYKDKKGQDEDMSKWADYAPIPPQQQNG